LFGSEQFDEFKRDFNSAVLQLVHRLQKDIPNLKLNEDVNRCKDTILVVHYLFMLCTLEEIFAKQNVEIANPNHFFERERKLREEPQFTKLQLRIREMLDRFKFT
jgi:hypothetical protein